MSKLSEEMARQEGMILRLYNEVSLLAKRIEALEQATLELARPAGSFIYATNPVGDAKGPGT